MKSFQIGFVSMVLLISLIGCGPKDIIKMDLTRFNENPGAYEDKRVIFTTDIATLLTNPDLYHLKDVEISGFVKRGNPRGGFWGFKLEDEDGRSVMCYETTYVRNPWYRADFMLKRAMNSTEPMTVVGNFRRTLDIELDWIEYGGETIDTDYKPPVHRVPFF